MVVNDILQTQECSQTKALCMDGGDMTTGFGTTFTSSHYTGFNCNSECQWPDIVFPYITL